MLNNFIKFQIILSVNLSGAVIIWCAAAHLSKKKKTVSAKKTPLMIFKSLIP